MRLKMSWWLVKTKRAKITSLNHRNKKVTVRIVKLKNTILNKLQRKKSRLPIMYRKKLLQANLNQKMKKFKSLLLTTSRKMLNHLTTLHKKSPDLSMINLKNKAHRKVVIPWKKKMQLKRNPSLPKVVSNHPKSWVNRMKARSSKTVYLLSIVKSSLRLRMTRVAVGTVVTKMK